MKTDKLHRMSTKQLDMLLQAELRKGTPDEEVVLPILEILESREQTPRKKHRTLISIAAAAAVFALLIAAVPKAVGADSAFEVLIRVTDHVLQFFAPGDQAQTAESDYTFQTDNPGLQQLYDQVVALGITDHIVPMWLPEGFTLVEIKVTFDDNRAKIGAIYKYNEKRIIITYKESSDSFSAQHEQLGNQFEVYEKDRIGHAIVQNNEKWTATWLREQVECVISADLSKEDLKSIIGSIYGRN